MLSPPPPPSNAVRNDQLLQITIKLGADCRHTFRAPYKSPGEAPLVEHEKVPAKRARADAAPEGSRPPPIPSAEGPHGVEPQVLATKRPRRDIRGPSDRYRSADADAAESKGKLLNTENQLRPTEAARVLPAGRRPPQPKDAGQSSSTTAKKITFSLALTKEEIIEDFTAMRLPLPARRPKKVPNSQFKHLFPAGSGLPKAVTPGRYTVKGPGNCHINGS